MTSSRSVQTNPVLSVCDLTFRYEQSGMTEPSVLCIGGLALTVEEGEIVCILGASGCGKSTLLNLIAGLLKPTSGTIEFSGDNDAERRIGYIFQQDALFPWRSVGQNLLLAVELGQGGSKTEAADRIAQYLVSFHLSDEILKLYPAQLSGGMRQRVSIIQALLFNPQLFLLDEPFSALDFYTKLRLENEFHQLVKEKNKAAVLVTHDIEESVAMGDRVLIMSRSGQITREFTIDLKQGDRLPENARGTARFAELYREIWAELKTVIEA